MKAIVLALAPWLMFAQGTPADYVRAQGLREKYQNPVVNAPGPVTWIAGANRFWYRKSVKGGYEFVLADAQTLTKAPAFDHAKLAASLAVYAQRLLVPQDGAGAAGLRTRRTRAGRRRRSPSRVRQRCGGRYDHGFSTAGTRRPRRQFR
jgi:hypothetical protein